MKKLSIWKKGYMGIYETQKEVRICTIDVLFDYFG